MKSFNGRFVRINPRLMVLASMTFLIASVGMLAAADQASAALVDGWGTLKGQIVVSGDVPEIPVENVGDGPDKEAVSYTHLTLPTKA